MNIDNIKVSPLETKLIKIIEGKIGKAHVVEVSADDLFKPLWERRDDKDAYDYKRFRRMMIANMRMVTVKLHILERFKIRRVSKLGSSQRAIYRIEKFSFLGVSKKGR